MKFNKTILAVISSFFFGSVSLFSQNNVGTLVTDPIRPFSVSSTHPSAIANEIKGGPFVSSNLAGLSNIPAPRLEIGAIGYATNTGLYYSLTSTNPTTWSSINGSNITNLSAANVTGFISFPNGVIQNLAIKFAATNDGFYVGNQLGSRFLAVVMAGSNIARFYTNKVIFDQPIDFGSSTSSAALTSRTNLGIQDFVTNSIVSIVSGGTGATNSAMARINLNLGWPALTNTNTSTSLLGVNNLGEIIYTLTNPITFTNLVRFGTAANTNTGSFASYISGIGYFHNGSNVWWVGTNNLEFSQPNAVRDNLGIGTNSVVRFGEVSATNLVGGAFMLSADSGGKIYEQTNFSFFSPSTIYFIGAVGQSATNWTAPIARTNLGLGWSALTNTNAANFRNAIGLGISNSVEFDQLRLGGSDMMSIRGITGIISFYDGIDGESVLTIPVDSDPVEINNQWNNPNVRSNLGLGATWLTNTNTPVFVNTNGNVVSPTNFWQQAPISTTVQYQTNVTGTSTNAATNSRNLFLFSLSPSVSGITNTVTLPTNPATTFEGDRATITHLANSTNAVTAIRQLGAATNLITLNQLDETVLLMYRSGAWRLADNISYIEPIYFSGTNAAANAAASRTNLGLGATNDVNFKSISSDGVISVGLDGTNSVSVNIGNFGFEIEGNRTSGLISFIGTNLASVFRSDIGLPLPALTNTNNANFQAAVLNTNAAPTNSANVNTVNFNTAVAWMEVHVFTNGSNTSFRIPLFK
jgi:hypothetical protein